MLQQCFLPFQLPCKPRTYGPASWVIDWFSFSAGNLASRNLFWGNRGKFWVTDMVLRTPALLGNLRFARPEWNPPLPTALTPNVNGSGNYWRKTKRGDETETQPLQLQGNDETSCRKSIPAHFLIYTQKFAYLGFQEILQMIAFPPVQH